MASQQSNGGPSAQQLATGLGWFSLGLGVTQMTAPGLVNRMIGVRDDPQSRVWQRLIALQELSAAGGILGRVRTDRWLRARTAADVVHIAMLMRARRSRGEHPVRVAMTVLSLLAVGAADAYASVEYPESDAGARTRSTTITVHEDPQAVEQEWRAFVAQRDDGLRLGPLKITDTPAGGVTKWQAADDSGIRAAGVTRFTRAPGGRGTEVHLQVEAPDGLPSIIQQVKGEDPRQRAADDLRRFKQLVETGVIARSQGAPDGSDARKQPIQPPAQPHGSGDR